MPIQKLTCDDCLAVKPVTAMVKMVNKETMQAHFVCQDCLRNYQINRLMAS
jgi:RNase P subunit RPR2